MFKKIIEITEKKKKWLLSRVLVYLAINTK